MVEGLSAGISAIVDPWIAQLDPPSRVLVGMYTAGVGEDIVARLQSVLTPETLVVVIGFIAFIVVLSAIPHPLARLLAAVILRALQFFGYADDVRLFIELAEVLLSYLEPAGSAESASELFRAQAPLRGAGEAIADALLNLAMAGAAGSLGAFIRRVRLRSLEDVRHHPIARHPEVAAVLSRDLERAIARYADEPWYTALSDDARRAHDEWFAGLSRESRDALHQDSALHAALARLDPDTRRLLTNCESPCFDPELDAQTLEELQRVVRRLRISPSHTGLRRYLSRAKQEGDTVTAVARLRDVRRPSDLDAILRASAEELVARAAPEIDASIAQLRPTNAELAAEIERSDLLREILYGAGLDTTDLERLWRNFQNRRSRLAPAHQTFEAYVGHLYGDSLHNPRLATRFPELFGTRASRLERHLAILETVEPNLADLIRGGDAGEFTALLTRLRRELARADFVGGATRLRLPRSRVRRFVLSFLASEVRSIDELRRVSGLLRRPEAVGALGEYYAALRLRDPGTFQSTDVAGRLDEDVRLRQRSFEPRPGLPLTGGGVRPDRVLPLPGGGEFALDIKFGYGARDVELGQARNFATLERVGEVRGSGYLFLPRGTRSARDAARRQLVFLRREGVDPLPRFFYVTETGAIRELLPSGSSVDVGTTVEDIGRHI